MVSGIEKIDYISEFIIMCKYIFDQVLFWVETVISGGVLHSPTQLFDRCRRLVFALISE